MALEAGTRLGSYEVVSSLGTGGMGEVYRAKDTKLGREVAIKVLPEGFSDEPERMARFEREAKILASLNHHNIATLYGFESEGDTQFLVMEVVEGETLADRIKHGAFPVEEALPLFLQIACSCVFEFLMDNPDEDPNWVKIERAYMDEADQHYRSVWSGMEKAERSNLRRVAEGKSIGRKYAFVNEELERRGYLVESEGGVGLCSDSFKGFVMRQNKERS